MFYSKFSSEFNELSLRFLKQQEVAKKWLKLKQSRKPHICGIRGLRVKIQESLWYENLTGYYLSKGIFLYVFLYPEGYYISTKYL